MAKKTHKSEVEQEQGYIAFLEKRLASANFKANVSPEEYEETQKKLKKARFKLRTLQIRRGRV